MFINTGADEAILKSLPIDNASKELVKAMNKEGLVQKKVAVQGKHGVHYRNQWVKASEDTKQDKPIQQPKTTDEFKVAIKSQFKSQKVTVTDQLGDTYDLDVNVNDKGIGVGLKRNGELFSVVTCKVSKDGKTSEVNKNYNMGNNYTEFGAYEKAYNILSSNEKKTNQTWKPPTKEDKPEKAKVTTKPKDEKNDNVEFDKTKSGKVGGIKVGKEIATVVNTPPRGAKKVKEVTDKDTGKTFDIMTDTNTSKPDGIVAVEKKATKPTTAKKSKEPAPKTGPKLSKDEAKAKTQSFTSKIGKTDKERTAFMDKVKAQGITWKEKDDKGNDVSVAIGWMRALMAMNKHFAAGGTFKG